MAFGYAENILSRVRRAHNETLENYHLRYILRGLEVLLESASYWREEDHSYSFAIELLHSLAHLSRYHVLQISLDLKLEEYDGLFSFEMMQAYWSKPHYSQQNENTPRLLGVIRTHGGYWHLVLQDT